MNSILDYYKEGDVGIEIGVLEGELSKRLITTNPSKLYLLDCWEFQSEGYSGIDTKYDGCNQPNDVQKRKYESVCEYFKEYDNVEIIKGFSLEVVNKFDDETYDCIYIDANHNYDSVKADLVAWILKVKIGGWISGHDWDHPDVKKALLEEFPNEDITAGIYPPQSWVIKKDR